MFEYLDLLKTKLETDFNTYLTTLSIPANSVLYRYIDIDTNTKNFNVILQYTSENFESEDIYETDYTTTMSFEVIFLVRKNREAITKINEIRNAFIKYIKEHNTLDNNVESVTLVSAEIDEEIEAIDSKDSKAIKFTIQIVDTI